MKNENLFEADGGRFQERLLWSPKIEAKPEGASFNEKRYECDISSVC
jgi:hypothetical protein